MLQGRLELQPGGGYHQPQRGIGQGHPLDVNKGQQQGARGGKPLFSAQHDARNQRVHRQHAGGEGDTNANQQRPQGGEGQTSGTSAGGAMAGACGTAFSSIGRGSTGSGGLKAGRWFSDDTGAAAVG
ncbi:Uncharacterised protein [Klebsiella pneumoniae subsp. pneumoniae]|uniref:Uncharacterized protein n=1 Tax=Klebsiella pneumoniae subsp. pneumoniae TaxID=72407 RepID=A0A378AQY7_KLEPN|nr:Uncharacterised protein [Klebsiella pneumoniae subsp. pneumoniae]